MTLEVGKTQSLEALTSWFLVLYWWDSLAKSLAWQFGEKNRSCTVSCTSVKNYHHLIEWRVLSWTRNSVWRAMNSDWLLLQSKQFKVKNHEFWVVYIADTFPNCYRFCNDVRIQKVTDRGANFLRSWLGTKNFESEQLDWRIWAIFSCPFLQKPFDKMKTLHVFPISNITWLLAGCSHRYGTKTSSIPRKVQI